jgi:hypothetical protein
MSFPFIHFHSKKKMSLEIIFKFSFANSIISITSFIQFFFKNTHMLDFPRMIFVCHDPKLFFLPCSVKQVAWQKHSFNKSTQVNNMAATLMWPVLYIGQGWKIKDLSMAANIQCFRFTLFC